MDQRAPRVSSVDVPSADTASAPATHPGALPPHAAPADAVAPADASWPLLPTPGPVAPPNQPFPGPVGAFVVAWVWLAIAVIVGIQLISHAPTVGYDPSYGDRIDVGVYAATLVVPALGWLIIATGVMPFLYVLTKVGKR